MNKIKLFALVLISMLALYSCDNDDDNNKNSWQPESNSEVKPITKNNRVIYEVNVRNYSAEGNFKGLQNDLPRLKELGADILWLMPIHPIGVENRSGSMGSPYSVRDYKAINPDFGTSADLKDLITAAHAAGMEIWLDWVANHTAWDHSWVATNFDFYAEKDGVRPYSPNGWTDVVQLDYNNSDMRAAMIDAMKYWVQEFDIDGYRCDAATFVPLSFWSEAKTEIEKVKKITWLCEGDNAEYMKVFDYDYAWGFSDAMNLFGKEGDLPRFVSECNKLFSNNSYANKGRMVYITNHDLNADHGTEFFRFKNNVLPMSILFFTIYDMPLIYNGQEVGIDKKMGLFEHEPVQWNPTNKIYFNLFKTLAYLKRSQQALENGANRGALRIYPTNNGNILVYSRHRGNNEVLIMLNFGNAPVKFKFTETAPNGKFNNCLKADTEEFSTQGGIILFENGYGLYVK